MDRLIAEVRQVSSWTMIFADDTAFYNTSMEQVEENLEKWSYTLERKVIKIRRSKTVGVGDRSNSDAPKNRGSGGVQLFKYLCSTL